MRHIIYIVAGFVSGSIMYSEIIPKKIKGIDVTEMPEDRNPGAANAIVQAGAPIGILCLLLDLLKGAAPVAMCVANMGISHILFTLVMAAPVIGHAVTLHHLNKKGGKAIAVSFGVLIGLLPHSYVVAALVASYLFFTLIVKIKAHGMRTIFAFMSASVASVFIAGNIYVAFGVVVISAVVIFKHYEVRYRIDEYDEVQSMTAEEDA